VTTPSVTFEGTIPNGHRKSVTGAVLKSLPTVAVLRVRGEGVRRDFSRLRPGRTGGSFEYAHVLSHMSEMGGAGISAL
jgi:hypothetical protein